MPEPLPETASLENWIQNEKKTTGKQKNTKNEFRLVGFVAQKNVTMIIMIGIKMYYLFKNLPIADSSHQGGGRGQQWAIFH